MRKICVVTSSRADYGIMSDFVRSLDRDKDVELMLIATGTHLSDRFGKTVQEIDTPITEQIDIEVEKGPAHALAQAIQKFHHVFSIKKPDILTVLGDRFEIMGVAQAAMLNNVPIAHISGGDVTEGAIDDAIRHSITKLSHLHFTSCEAYRKRVIQLGENPLRVFNVGSLGVEKIKKTPLMSKQELEESLDYRFREVNFLVTFHPVTLEGQAGAQFYELLKALESFSQVGIIMTCPNCDEGNEQIFRLINTFQSANKNVKVFTSLGSRRYLSAMKYVNTVIGNSSSGIIEAPCFQIPTVNIGNRQRGRIQATSILNCPPERHAIHRSIQKALTTDCSCTVNPYDHEGTSDSIISILKTFPLENLTIKEFFDL